MKDGRGQVALEFLLTYGWAILLITVIALLLWQMGVFNPAGQVRPGSSGFWGVVPFEDFTYNDEGVLMIPISNKVGGRIDITAVNATVEGNKYDDDVSDELLNHMDDNNATIDAGRIRRWTSPATSDTGFPEMAAGAHYNIFVSIRYEDNRTGEEYLSSGWIWGNVEVT